MNILFVVNGIGKTDGSSKQLAMTINAMAEYGHLCYVYTFNKSSCGQTLAEGVLYIPEPYPAHKRWQQWFIVPPRIRNIVKKRQIDIVIGWRTNGGCYAVLAAIGTSAKVVFSERSDPYMEDNTLIHRIVGFIASYADSGVFQTEKARDFYRRLRNHSVVIPNPYDLQNTYLPIMPWKGRQNKLVHVGRLSIKQKRQDLLLKSFKMIREKNPSYTLHIYGTGPDEFKLKELAKDMENAVVFRGAVENVLEEIRDAKLMLLTSDYEGIPNVALEAFCMGVPVVATDCSPGGMRVLVENGINGYIVPFRDYKALACKANDVLNDSKLAEMFIENSKKKMRIFDSERIFTQWNNHLMTLK